MGSTSIEEASRTGTISSGSTSGGSLRVSLDLSTRSIGCATSQRRSMVEVTRARPSVRMFYLPALKTLPDLSITFGQFKRRQERMTKVARHGAGRERVLVWKTEEKGSDVNIATYLIWDALRGDGDASLVISGDTDLVLPIRMLTEELGRKVGVADGTLDRLPASQLTDAASFVLKIRIGPLADSQLQANLVDAAGVFHRPPKWDPPPPP